MGKKSPKAPGNHPDGFYIYFVRSDNGDAKAYLFNGSKYIETAARAAWDDAIPWSAKTYETTCNGIVGNKGGLEFRFDENLIPYREGVLLHPGLGGKTNYSDNPKAQIYYNYGSYGCLVAQKDFINHAYKKAIKSGQTDANGLADVPIVVADKDAHTNIGLKLTAKGPGDIVETSKGDMTTFKVKLTGDPNGVSKAMWVFIKVTASGGNPGETVYWQYNGLKKTNPKRNEADTTHNPPDSPSGFYVKIPKFKKVAKFKAGITSDTNSDLNFTIDSYLFDSPKKAGTHRWYSDYKAIDSGLPKVLIQNGGDRHETLRLIQSLDNLNLNTSGGAEGFNQTYTAKKGATYHIDFNAFSVPDSIRVYDNKYTYVDSGGFISGQISKNFTVSSNSDGRIHIVVTGSGSDTAWDLSAYLVSA